MTATPLQDGSFRTSLLADGVKVDNLGGEPLLPWAVFQQAVCVMICEGDDAARGDALDSIKGNIAQAVYGKKPGVAESALTCASSAS